MEHGLRWTLQLPATFGEAEKSSINSNWVRVNKAETLLSARWKATNYKVINICKGYFRPLEKLIGIEGKKKTRLKEINLWENCHGKTKPQRTCQASWLQWSVIYNHSKMGPSAGVSGS